jgi:hypothetical protein
VKHICPICGYSDLREPVYTAGKKGPSYEICASCSFEFGYDDESEGFTFEQWREIWIKGGMVWDRLGHSASPPNWDPKKQLENIGIYL